MNKSNKTIPVLLKELKGLESKLTEAYKQLGNKLIKDTADPVAEANGVSQENFLQKNVFKNSTCGFRPSNM